MKKYAKALCLWEIASHWSLSCSKIRIKNSLNMFRHTTQATANSTKTKGRTLFVWIQQQKKASHLGLFFVGTLSHWRRFFGSRNSNVNSVNMPKQMEDSCVTEYNFACEILLSFLDVLKEYHSKLFQEFHWFGLLRVTTIGGCASLSQHMAHYRLRNAYLSGSLSCWFS